MYSVYVIVSEDGRRYTGHSSDVVRRLAEHNGGLCKSTKSTRNWRIVHTESFRTRGEAMKRERQLKSGQGRAFLDRLAAKPNPPDAG